MTCVSVLTIWCFVYWFLQLPSYLNTRKLNTSLSSSIETIWPYNHVSKFGEQTVNRYTSTLVLVNWFIPVKLVLWNSWRGRMILTSFFNNVWWFHKQSKFIIRKKCFFLKNYLNVLLWQVYIYIMQVLLVWFYFWSSWNISCSRIIFLIYEETRAKCESLCYTLSGSSITVCVVLYAIFVVNVVIEVDVYTSTKTLFTLMLPVLLFIYLFSSSMLYSACLLFLFYFVPCRWAPARFSKNWEKIRTKVVCCNRKWSSLWLCDIKKVSERQNIHVPWRW